MTEGASARLRWFGAMMIGPFLRQVFQAPDRQPAVDLEDDLDEELEQHSGRLFQMRPGLETEVSFTSSEGSWARISAQDSRTRSPAARGPAASSSRILSTASFTVKTSEPKDSGRLMPKVFSMLTTSSTRASESSPRSSSRLSSGTIFFLRKKAQGMPAAFSPPGPASRSAVDLRHRLLGPLALALGTVPSPRFRLSLPRRVTGSGSLNILSPVIRL